ncbi:MAG: Flp pilus assembly complex ATPase component TadA [Candidatus Schekmanbacteria bacterium]|nr:Flp pilus assembly complex ATPase component TadA [Candidatus Schekmanbacteria bacterium]
MTQAKTHQDLERELVFRKKLAEVTNAINLAASLEDLLLHVKDNVLEVIDAEIATVFAVDSEKSELRSLHELEEAGEIQEIRLPIDHCSIAGFAASATSVVAITDVYDELELKRLHPELRFDRRWDLKSGYRTRSILAAPLELRGERLGVLEIINRRGGVAFTDQDRESAEEVARVLAIALHNLRRSSQIGRPAKFGYLVQKRLITSSQLEEAITEARIQHLDVANVLMKRFEIPQKEIGRALSSFYGVPFFAYDGVKTMSKDLVSRVPVDVLLKLRCAPVNTTSSGLMFMAVDDPFDLTRMDAIRALRFATRYEFQAALLEDIYAYLSASYGLKNLAGDGVAAMRGMEQDIGALLKELGQELGTSTAAALGQPDELDESDSNVVKLANRIVLEAFSRGASDIHIEPYGIGEPCEVRFRIDGACQTYVELPGQYRSALIQRFKIMAQLDISERRLPQDGKIKFPLPNGGQIELRVASLPTAGGNEDIVMRILGASKPLPLASMGFSDWNLQRFKQVASEPYGIVLVVGPTGSGKTTTLHSALAHINTKARKIWTAEDPVEITQRGLRQVQVFPKIGLTFAACMRSFLRADPDVIMVGEMRDQETAGIAIEASLTGHLVLSTLHTNSAPETITRLLEMDIDPYNFADSLLGVLAQRLVRALCKSCKRRYEASADEIAELRTAYGPAAWDTEEKMPKAPVQLYQKGGCKDCGRSGYRGRLAIHELLINSDEIRHLVQQRRPVAEIREQARREGMRTLLQDGVAKVLLGHTDFPQVRAVCLR